MTRQRVCVVTGSNKGIGFAIVKELCSTFEGLVYLTARDVSRGQEAVKKLNELGHSPKFHQLDIEDIKSIENLAKHLKETYGGLDVLVNNAGFAFNVDATDAFAVQAEVTVRINYFSTLQVCHHLFPILKPHARVVHVSSMAGLLKHLNQGKPQGMVLIERIKAVKSEDDVNNIMNEFVSRAKSGDFAEHGFVPNTYCISKIGINAITKVQQRIFDKDERADLVVNSCHPGYVDTDMSNHKGTLTIEEGAVCPLYLAVLPPNILEPKGKFLWNDKTIRDFESIE